jgi:fumarate reductase subunit C
MSKTPADKKTAPFALERANYLILLAGVGVIALGFTIMALDSEQHGFGFLGLTLGPIVVMLGFIAQFFAILYKPKKSA